MVGGPHQDAELPRFGNWPCAECVLSVCCACAEHVLSVGKGCARYLLGAQCCDAFKPRPCSCPGQAQAYLWGGRLQGRMEGLRREAGDMWLGAADPPAYLTRSPAGQRHNRQLLGAVRPRNSPLGNAMGEVPQTAPL